MDEETPLLPASSADMPEAPGAVGAMAVPINATAFPKPGNPDAVLTHGSEVQAGAGATPPATASQLPAGIESAEAQGLPAVNMYVDGFDSAGRIAGWACVPGHSGRRVTVSVLDDGDVIATGLADLPRPDVRDAGYGDGWCGFILPLPERLLLGPARILAVRGEAQDATPLIRHVALEPQTGDTVAAAPDAAARAMPQVVAAPLRDGRAAVYIPGSYVACRQPFAKPVYHTEGWHAPEQEFTWIAGLEGTIEMVLRRPHRSYTFTIDVVPNMVGQRLQTMEVFFNYFRVCFFEIPSPTTLTVELPSELFILRTPRISLHCRQAISGTAHGVPDARRLGVAVRGWRIS